MGRIPDLPEPCSCQGDRIRKINVDGTMIGVVGLDELFFQVYISGIEDEDKLKEELLKGAKGKNYIPERAEESYKKALFEEYKRFLQSQKGGDDV